MNNWRTMTVAMSVFLLACVVGISLPRATERVAKGGEASVGDLLDTGGLYLSMVLTQIVCALVQVAVWIPLVLSLMALFGLGVALMFGGPLFALLGGRQKQLVVRSADATLTFEQPVAFGAPPRHFAAGMEALELWARTHQVPFRAR
mgnify:CR=1 FL=1